MCEAIVDHKSIIVIQFCAFIEKKEKENPGDLAYIFGCIWENANTHNKMS